MEAAAPTPQRRADVHSCWKIGVASIDESITTAHGYISSLKASIFSLDLMLMDYTLWT